MPIVTWPDPFWDPQEFSFWDAAKSDTCTVTEEEEPDVIKSRILGPDGKPILYEYESEKLGFIGFVDPDEIERIRLASAKAARKRRRQARADARKSKV